MKKKSAYPLFRTFQVLTAFRRYARVEYMCGGVYTMLEHDTHGVKRFGELEKLQLRLVNGSYRLRGEWTEFAPHELTELLQKKMLTELPPESFRKNKTKRPRR